MTSLFLYACLLLYVLNVYFNVTQQWMVKARISFKKSVYSDIFPNAMQLWSAHLHISRVYCLCISNISHPV